MYEVARQEGKAVRTVDNQNYSWGNFMIYEDAPTGSPSKSSGSNDVKTIRKNVFEYS